MPEPKRCLDIGNRRSNLQPRNYSTSLLSLMNAVRKKVSRSDFKVSPPEDFESASLQAQIAHYIFICRVPHSSFVEACSNLVATGETACGAREMVITAMTQCEHMHKKNWETCEVPRHIIEYFGMAIGRVDITPRIQKTHRADKTTNVEKLKSHTKRSIENSRYGQVTSLPTINLEKIIDYPVNKLGQARKRARLSTSSSSSSGGDDSDSSSSSSSSSDSSSSDSSSSDSSSSGSSSSSSKSS
jgi:uncharacterized membrane protein YgcG